MPASPSQGGGPSQYREQVLAESPLDDEPTAGDIRPNGAQSPYQQAGPVEPTEAEQLDDAIAEQNRSDLAEAFGKDEPSHPVFADPSI